MLKLLDPAKSFSGFGNLKCGEVFLQSEEMYCIVCTQCEMKSFAFEDFLRHFKNVHLLSHDKIYIKREEDIVTEQQEDQDLCAFQEIPISVEVQCSWDNSEDATDVKVDIPVPTNKQDCLSLRAEDSDASDDDSNGDLSSDKEYIPKILKPEKKLEKVGDFKCTKCKRSYKFAKNLERHIKVEHSSTPDNEPKLEGTKEATLFPCSQCDKVYKARESLYSHRFTHSGERQFKCDFENCGKSFFTKKNLSNHKRIVHIAERNFVCEVCGFRTKNQPSLIVHKRSHTGEKPFICKTCGKAFASSSLLREHQPIHSTERPHVCDVCGAAFSRQKALYHHKHLHLGVKKFLCKFCGKAYAQAAGLAGHVRQHKAEML